MVFIKNLVPELDTVEHVISTPGTGLSSACTEFNLHLSTPGGRCSPFQVMKLETRQFDQGQAASQSSNSSPGPSNPNTDAPLCLSRT